MPLKRSLPGKPRLAPEGPARAASLSQISTPDYPILVISVFLTCLCVVMVFSASGLTTLTLRHDSTYFLRKDILASIVALVCLIFTTLFDFRYYRKIAVPITGIAFLMLVAVLIPGIGIKVNGARRWLNLGIFPFQAAELAKLALVIFFAAFLAQVKERVQDIRVFATAIAITGVFGLLVMLEPDFGMTIVMFAVVIAMMFISGARWTHIGGFFLLSLPVVHTLIMHEGYRARRFLAFLDPWKDMKGAGFHIIQSLIAISSGGFLGVGLGMSKQKRFFLPEQHTDFIFSIVLEEFGVIGMVFLILMLLYLIYRGFCVAMRCQDTFGSLLAFGITFNIGIQAFINMGVAVGILPVTGLTLPFISFGGASLTVMYMSIGILLNISMRAGPRPRSRNETAGPGGGRHGRAHLSGNRAG
jgi:cell division protein FtsW